MFETIKSVKDALKRDIRVALKFVEFQYLWRKSGYKNDNVINMFRKIAGKHPNKVAINFEDQKWTFRDLDEFSNRIANCFTNNGFVAGDEIALIMNNKPEYIGIWLGLAKAGIISAFINTNNKMGLLIDCFTAFKCKAVIYDSHFTKEISEIYDTITEKMPTMKFYNYSIENNNNNPSSFPSKPLYQLLPNFSKNSLDVFHKRNFDDTLLYIFTSGTTGGKCKAAIISDSRVIIGAYGHKCGFRFKDSDVFYVALPLYHAFAGVMGVAQTLIYGNTVTLAEKFSASSFWSDCIQHNCTIGLYIGETTRYLLSQPEKPEDKDHSIRLMYGLGLKKEFWSDFKTRFGIKHICEFYGATESNIYIANIDDREGSCGFIPYYYGIILRILYPSTIVKVDPITLEPVRNKKGLCSMIGPGEVGVIVGKHVKTDPIKNYKGYTNRDETEKKFINDVLSKGDTYFVSGDLLEMDKFGYLYFKDRTGDTFRWKGENVSTTDVEAVLQNIMNMNDCTVYGVSVGNTEGNAGMAVIKANHNEIDFKQLYNQLSKRLPSYAIPLFIRCVDRIDITGSFKLIKYRLKEIGFDINLTNDKIYYFDKNFDNYFEIDSNIYQRILSGELRF